MSAPKNRLSIFRRPQWRLHSGLLLVSISWACASYQARPLDLHQILADLNRLEWTDPDPAPSSDDGNSSEDAVEAWQLASFAVRNHPALKVARAQIGVQVSLLEEAGLWPNPEFGWDGMDVLAAEVAGDGADSVDFLSGLGISFPLFRPGERDALSGLAQADLDRSRAQLLEAEWLLSEQVFIACENWLEAKAQVGLNLELTKVAQSTRDYFQTAREVGAATAIQASLAQGDLLVIQTEGIRRESQLRRAGHSLRALMGLPPQVQLPRLQSPKRPGKLADNPEQALEVALEHRPDLAVLRSAYQAAEERVKLEVSQQFPQLSLGTGLAIIPTLLSHWNRPAIRTAEAQRTRLAKVIETRVHNLRREVFDAFFSLQEEVAELEYLEGQVIPNAENSRQMANRAFELGEATLLEILAVQRSWVNLRSQLIESRAELARRHWQLLAASGQLLIPTTSVPKP